MSIRKKTGLLLTGCCLAISWSAVLPGFARAEQEVCSAVSLVPTSEGGVRIEAVGNDERRVVEVWKQDNLYQSVFSQELRGKFAAAKTEVPVGRFVHEAAETWRTTAGSSCTSHPSDGSSGVSGNTAEKALRGEERMTEQECVAAERILHGGYLLYRPEGAETLLIFYSGGEVPTVQAVTLTEDKGHLVVGDSRCVNDRGSVPGFDFDQWKTAMEKKAGLARLLQVPALTIEASTCGGAAEPLADGAAVSSAMVGTGTEECVVPSIFDVAWIPSDPIGALPLLERKEVLRQKRRALARSKARARSQSQERKGKRRRQGNDVRKSHTLEASQL